MKFKIEADEREVKRMLKEKKNISLYSTLNYKDKRYVLGFFWIFVGLLLLALLIYGFLYFVKELNKDYISKDECKQLINEKVNEIKYLDKWDRAFNAIEPFFAGLILAVMLGWIIHGVGFKIIGR